MIFFHRIYTISIFFFFNPKSYMRCIDDVCTYRCNFLMIRMTKFHLVLNRFCKLFIIYLINMNAAINFNDYETNYCFSFLFFFFNCFSFLFSQSILYISMYIPVPACYQVVNCFAILRFSSKLVTNNIFLVSQKNVKIMHAGQDICTSALNNARCVCADFVKNVFFFLIQFLLLQVVYNFRSLIFL